jgi:HK97 family phage portal protein
MSARSKRRRKEKRRAAAMGVVWDSTTSSPASWFVDWIRQRESDSGVEVTGQSIMQYAPVWYAVNKIAGRISQLPLLLYRVRGKKRTERDEATAHPAYRLMRDLPNDMMTPSVFKETMMHHVLLWGNGRAAIVRNGRKDPVEVWPMLPDRTTTVLIGREQTASSESDLLMQPAVAWEKWHRLEVDGKTAFFHDDDVLHISGLGYDGIVGYSPIDYARNSVGLGLASERQSNRHYKYGAVPGLMLKAPAGVFRKAEDAAEFLRQFREYHEGSDNVGKTALLREGIEPVPLTMSAKDSETAILRQMQREEVEMLFGIESMPGDKAASSYGSLEQRTRSELINTLGRWLNRWVEECNIKLLTWKQRQDRSHEFQFDTQELLTATLQETMEFLGSAIDKRILSPNEARDWLGYPPYVGGDTYENPNTTSGKQSTTDDQEPDDDETKDDEGEPAADDTSAAEATAARATATAKRLLASRLQELIRVESHRAEQAAAKPGEFIGWLDAFYSVAEFGGVIRKAYTLAGDSGQWATYHIDASKQALLTVAGHANTERLSRDVARELAEWPIRAEWYADAILTGELKETP